MKSEPAPVEPSGAPKAHGVHREPRRQSHSAPPFCTRRRCLSEPRPQTPFPGGADWGSKLPPAQARSAERACARLSFNFSDRGLPKVDLDPGQPFADHAG